MTLRFATTRRSGFCWLRCVLHRPVRGNVLAMDAELPHAAETGVRARTISRYDPSLAAAATLADRDATGAAWQSLFERERIGEVLLRKDTLTPAQRAGLQRAGAVMRGEQGQAQWWSIADDRPATMSVLRQGRYYLLIGVLQWLLDWGVMVGVEPCRPAGGTGQRGRPHQRRAAGFLVERTHHLFRRRAPHGAQAARALRVDVAGDHGGQHVVDGRHRRLVRPAMGVDRQAGGRTGVGGDRLPAVAALGLQAP